MEPINSSNIIGFPATPASLTINRKLAIRWGEQEILFARPEGWVGVPDSFLRLYPVLKPYSLTVGEAMFVLQLMSYKWSQNAPFPSYKSLAARMGVTDKMVRRYAANLEGKGYLRRTARIGSTNTFDLNPFICCIGSGHQRGKEATEGGVNWLLRPCAGVNASASIAPALPLHHG